MNAGIATLAAALLIALTAGPSAAAVYKYQDEHGKWHFTDQPPADAGGTEVSAGGDGGQARDYRRQLEERYRPTTEVDRAMLAVVTVNTAVGGGSGFFVSDDGYLVTNRHVVRPSTSSQARDMRARLDSRQRRLEQFEGKLEHEADRLAQMRSTIDEERAYAESGSASADFKKRYRRYVERYDRDMSRHKSELARYRKFEGEFKKDKSEFGFTSSLTDFSRRFTVTLRDGSSARARLIKVSKQHDLALLKLDNSITPHLSPAGNPRPRQGTRVYAIGSPLGISDALTTGIVTKADREFLFTDTQILPGNSGGPLIDGDGGVIGVNTAIVTGNTPSEGLGLAIYASHIRAEFARELAGKF